MLLAGDELSHSQKGNNNGYCQDNAITWLDWDLDDRRLSFLEFTRRMIHLRADQPVLHLRRFFHGRNIRGSEVKDIMWFRESGEEMSDEDWCSAPLRYLGVRWDGTLIDDVDHDGNAVRGDTLLLLFNGNHEAISFKLPKCEANERWIRVCETTEGNWEPLSFSGDQSYDLADRSTTVFRLEADGQGDR